MATTKFGDYVKEILIDVRSHTEEERKVILNILKNSGAEVKFDYWCGYIVVGVEEDGK